MLNCVRPYGRAWLLSSQRVSMNITALDLPWNLHCLWSFWNATPWNTSAKSCTCMGGWVLFNSHLCSKLHSLVEVVPIYRQGFFLLVGSFLLVSYPAVSYSCALEIQSRYFVFLSNLCCLYMVAFLICCVVLVIDSFTELLVWVKMAYCHCVISSGL